MQRYRWLATTVVIVLAGLIASLTSLRAGAAQPPRQLPNIVYILADDKYQCAAENHVESTESTVNSANRPTVLNHRRLL